MAQIDGPVVTGREIDGRGRLAAVHDLQTFQKRKTQIPVVRPLERRFVTDKDKSVVERKEMLRFLT